MAADGLHGVYSKPFATLLVPPHSTLVAISLFKTRTVAFFFLIFAQLLFPEGCIARGCKGLICAWTTGSSLSPCPSRILALGANTQLHICILRFDVGFSQHCFSFLGGFSLVLCSCIYIAICPRMPSPLTVAWNLPFLCVVSFTPEEGITENRPWHAVII